MSAPKSDTIHHDYKQVLAFLEKRNLIAVDIPDQLNSGLRKMHRYIYSLCIWSHFLNLPEHGQVYINELASDAIQILPHAAIGFKKSSRLLARGVIENLMRHVYFLDHPVEFERQNLDAKWYMSAEQLFDYARNHPRFTQTEVKFNALGRLRKLYGELSAEVHGGKSVHLDQYTALKDMKLDMNAFNNQVSFVENTAGSVNFVLLIFHSDRMSKIAPSFQKVLFATMAKKARRVAKGLE